LYRNHGLVGRDEVAIWGRNSRLDSLHAVIANRLIDQTAFITQARIANARRYDEAFADVPEIAVPRREPDVVHTYHLYMVRAQRRDALLRHLQHHGIEAKVHYPVPLHLQPAARELGYRRGAFPRAEADAETLITLPAHQHLREEEIEYTIARVRDFYGYGR
jgi:aminotransferase EvaB